MSFPGACSEACDLKAVGPDVLALPVLRGLEVPGPIARADDGPADLVLSHEVESREEPKGILLCFPQDAFYIHRAT